MTKALVELYLTSVDHEAPAHIGQITFLVNDGDIGQASRALIQGCSQGKEPTRRLGATVKFEIKSIKVEGEPHDKLEITTLIIGDTEGCCTAVARLRKLGEELNIPELCTQCGVIEQALEELQKQERSKVVDLPDAATRATRVGSDSNVMVAASAA